jgi:hypothetical protein
MYKTILTLTFAHHSHQMEKSSPSHIVLHTHFSKDCVAVKVNLNNYNGLTDSKKHIQNVKISKYFSLENTKLRLSRTSLKSST